MSIFYLSPVKGDLPLYLLETIVIKRLEFLKAIYNKQSFVYNEFLLEGSVYDTAGHYMLCIIFILESNSELINFFVKSEKALFKHRLNLLTAYEIRRLARKILSITKKYETNCLDALNTLCQHLKIKHIAQHINSDECHANCCLHFISVRYTDCLPFVSNREINLEKGNAYIPCSKWKTYLTILFKINLRKKLSKNNLNCLKDDPRITDLISKVRRLFKIDNNCSINLLKSIDVDNMSKLFPPCMLNLHHHLRKKHRLSHDQRFYYSLFLKDIGMPVKEAVTYWREEYEQVPNGNNKCCHNWKSDEKKFVYGIRHLYGLEGGRKNYNFGSCVCILNSDTSCSEGGCPFKSFDDDAMMQLLDIKKPESLLSQIKELQTKRQYTSACVLYLRHKFNSVPNNNYDNIYNFSPVKYYLHALKCKP